MQLNKSALSKLFRKASMLRRGGLSQSVLFSPLNINTSRVNKTNKRELINVVVVTRLSWSNTSDFALTDLH